MITIEDLICAAGSDAVVVFYNLLSPLSSPSLVLIQSLTAFFIWTGESNIYT